MTEETAEAPEATPLEAIAALRDDKAFGAVLMNPRHEGHVEATAKWASLFAAAYPSGDEEREDSAGLAEVLDVEAALPHPGESDEDVAARLEAEVSLRGSYGEQMEAKIEIARSAVVALGGEQLLDRMIDTGMANDADIVRSLVELSEANERYPLVAAIRELGEKGTTPEQAEFEIAKLKGDKEFMDMLFDGGAMGHDFALARWEALFLAAEPPEWVSQLGDLEA